MAAARTVALNPAPARQRAWDWRWSSARAHLAARDDALATVAPLLERCNFRFGDLIDAPASDEAMAALRGAETIGRPLGSPAFLDSLAALTGRDPRPRKRGPNARPSTTREDGFGNVSLDNAVGIAVTVTSRDSNLVRKQWSALPGGLFALLSDVSNGQFRVNSLSNM